MENNVTKVNSLNQVIGIMEMQTRLFRNAVQGMEANRETRPNEHTNHVGWLAGHLVSTRHMMAAMTGVQIPEPHPELFGNGKGIDPAASYPSLEKCVQDWDAITPKMMEGLRNVPESVLAGKSPFATPMGDTVGDLMGFLAHHEAYHIGQLSTLRKYYGLEGMKYS